MLLYFKCPACGEYAVTQDTFDAFLSPELRQKLESAHGVHHAVLSFENECPKCARDTGTGVTKGSSNVSLSVFRQS